MDWLIGIVVGGFIIVCLMLRNKQKKEVSLRASLLEEWGKPLKKGYYNFNLIDQYFRNNEAKENAWHVISDQLVVDLDLQDLFKYLDRTTSKIGQQFLYYKLRVIESANALTQFQKLTDLFESNEKLRLDVQVQLSNLSTSDNYDLERLISNEEIEKPNYRKYLLPLSLAGVTFIILGFFNTGFFFILLPLFMLNAYFHYKTKGYIACFQTAVSQLNKTHRVAEHIADQKLLSNYFQDFDFIKDLKRIRSKMRFIEFEKNINDEYAIVAFSVIELFNIMFNFEALVFYSFIDDVFKRQDQIHNMYRFVGEIDCAIAVASLKHKHSSICVPEFSARKQVCFNDLTHPLVENCIPNDLQLDKESLLLTGSNMSGKTTFIREVALSSLTAQTLHVAFANSFKLPFLKLYSSIRISDDISESTSYYLKEVLVVKEFLEASKCEDPCLFIMDEIFKGTNTVERIAGAKAILSYLNNRKDLVFVSTHDIELAELLGQEHFGLYHFAEEIVDGELCFDHKLKEGPLKRRNAIKILDVYGYPQSIVEEATTISNKLSDYSLDDL